MQDPKGKCRDGEPVESLIPSSGYEQMVVTMKDQSIPKTYQRSSYVSSDGVNYKRVTDTFKGKDSLVKYSVEALL
jgi:hypothetical protein